MPRQMIQPRKDTLREHLARAADRIEALATENAQLRAQLAKRNLWQRLVRWVKR